MGPEARLIIDGGLVSGAASGDVINPATGVSFARCGRANRAQLNAAIASARDAFIAWSETAIESRQQALDAIAGALMARIEEFAELLTLEQGKPRRDSLHEIQESVAIIQAFASMELPDVVLRDSREETIVRQFLPLGVVAAITPWNYPMVLLMMKVAPALLAGNTVVVKPAPTTPLCTLKFGALCMPLLPRGVLNIIADEDDLGDALTGHPHIAKVAFTGSISTGRRVMASAAGSVARVTLELGGNDPAIVLEDVDVPGVAERVFRGAMANAGQMCFAIKRVYVPERLYEKMCAALAEQARATVVGDGLDATTDMGPLQNARQYAKTLDFLGEAHARGRIIAGGHRLDRSGYFVAPTIVRDMAEDSRLVQEEQFSPILPVLRYRDIDDAVVRANSGPHGLGASVWCEDTACGFAVAQRIVAGTVWINRHLNFPIDVAACGAKQSGYGFKMGRRGLEEFTQARVINRANSRVKSTRD